MAAMLATPGRGRSRTRKDLPYAFIGAGSATQNEKVSSLDSALAEVQIWLIALVICQTALAQVASHLAAVYLAVVSLHVSAVCDQASNGDQQGRVRMACEEGRALQALPEEEGAPQEQKEEEEAPRGAEEKAPQALPGASRHHLGRGGLSMIVMLVLAVASVLHNIHQQQARAYFESSVIVMCL